MTDAAFWDKIADRYAARPVGNPDAYARTLDRVRAHLQPADRVLEVGCGTGTTALTLAPHVAAITGIDFSRAMIDIARRKAAETQATSARFEVSDLKSVSGSHDAVLAMNVLHLVADTPRALSHLREAIRPGGLLISKTPCLGSKRLLVAPMIAVLRLFGMAPSGPVRYLKEADLEAMIRQAGFEIVEAGSYPAGSRFVVARRPE